MEKGHTRSAFNFNKQIVFAEIGALVFAFPVAFIASKFFTSEATISKFSLCGTILGAGIFWIATRINDNSKNKNYSKNDLLRDMSYFTPVAFILTLILYYPPLYYLTKLFLGEDHMVLFSVFFAQLAALSLFLIGINLYRYSLIKFFNKYL